MEIYIGLLILLSITAYYNKKTSIIVSLIFLFIIAAFRSYDVGTDTNNYMIAYESIEKYDTLKYVLFGWESHMEFFYRFIFYIARRFNADFRMVLIIQTIIFVVPLHFFLKKTGTNEGLALLLIFITFFYFKFFNISRQICAASLCGFAYIFLEKGKNVYSIITIILTAIFVHATALLLLFLVMFDKYKKEVPDYVIVLTLIISFVIPYYFDYTSAMFSFLDYFSVVRFDRYLMETNTTVYYGRLLPSILFLYLYYINKNNHNLKISIYFKAYFLQVVFYNFFSTMPVVGDRMMLVFLVGSMIFWCDCIVKKKILASIPIIGMNLLLFIQSLLANSEGILPYKFL